MKQGHEEEHWLDTNENPAGGCSYGVGFAISWQNGPLGKVVDLKRKEPNGAFVEDVIAAVIGRLEFYQRTRFACGANAQAIEHLKAAAYVLDQRTMEREKRQVEGTHAI